MTGKGRWFFIAIIILAAILRFYKLGDIPVGLEWDEVALGYDAYSISQTAKDQFGTFLPLTFRSLDDYKPPIYIYATVPGVALFGLNDFTTRFPAAFFGTAAVISTFFLAQELTKSKKIALIASLFLSFSPWHLQFSRAAFEVNISDAITIAAVACFLIGLKKPKIFILAAILFGLDLFSYHSTRVVAPIIMLTLFVLFNKRLPSKKYITIFFIVFAAFFLAVLPILRSKEAQIRFIATNIFTPGARYLDDKDLEKVFLEKRLEDTKAGFETAGKIFHNQRLKYLDYDTLKKAFNNYISNFGFDYLFIKGDVPLHHAPGFGLLYIAELPFILIGLGYILLKARSPYTLLILIWMLIVPLPSAVTRQAPHAVRTELFLPTYQILSALGLFAIYSLAKKQSLWVYLTSLSAITTILSVNQSFYLHQYYVHTNYELSKYWIYGRREAVEFTEKEKNNYENVTVSLNADMPYIFWLYYSKYPPKEYLKKGGTVSGGFADQRNSFDKYLFRNFNYEEEKKLSKKQLLIGTKKDFPPDINPLKIIKYINGEEALFIVKTDGS